jgi:glycosyltransferase involved in cell wall biosynthesis
MSSDPLVSIIMPVYNVGRVLPHAIESVLRQTRADFELIVVDDASGDATPSVIDHYRSLDPRIRTVRNSRNSRTGPVEWEPRNDGLKLARGTFIAYLDGDNSWEPDTLGILSEELMRRPEAQLVYCRSRNFHASGEIDTIIAADSRSAVDRGDDWVVFAQDQLDPGELGRSQYVDTNEMMHRTAVFRALGSLWSTAHPRRACVNRHQGKQCPYRRHNDLELVERIIGTFGVDSVVQVPDVLVNFFYPSAVSRPATSYSSQSPSSRAFESAS